MAIAQAQREQVQSTTSLLRPLIPLSSFSFSFFLLPSLLALSRIVRACLQSCDLLPFRSPQVSLESWGEHRSPCVHRWPLTRETSGPCQLKHKQRLRLGHSNSTLDGQPLKPHSALLSRIIGYAAQLSDARPCRSRYLVVEFYMTLWLFRYIEALSSFVNLCCCLVLAVAGVAVAASFSRPKVPPAGRS